MGPETWRHTHSETVHWSPHVSPLPLHSMTRRCVQVHCAPV